MVDVFQVADLFVTHAIKTHGAEVGIIAYYGSHASGTASPTSDLDLIFIPDDGKASSLAACFLLDGIAFDFFPISWARAERLATGADGWAVGPALIAQAKVLYARSDADAARLKALQGQITKLQQPDQKPHMVARAIEKFKAGAYALENLRFAAMQGDPSSVRIAGWKVLMAAVECLALVNQVYFRRGWDANTEEILQLSTRPANLEQWIHTIALSPDPSQIVDAATALVSATRTILLEEQQICRIDTSINEMFRNYYPEIRDKINKIRARTATQQPIGASWVAMFIQEEISQFIAQVLGGVAYSEFNLYHEYAPYYRQLALPEIVLSSGAADRELVAADADQLDEAVQAWLGRHGVALNVCDTLEEVAHFLAAQERKERNTPETEL